MRLGQFLDQLLGFLNIGSVVEFLFSFIIFLSIQALELDLASSWDPKQMVFRSVLFLLFLLDDLRLILLLSV